MNDLLSTEEYEYIRSLRETIVMATNRLRDFERGKFLPGDDEINTPWFWAEKAKRSVDRIELLKRVESLDKQESK